MNHSQRILDSHLHPWPPTAQKDLGSDVANSSCIHMILISKQHYRYINDLLLCQWYFPPLSYHFFPTFISLSCFFYQPFPAFPVCSLCSFNCSFLNMIASPEHLVFYIQLSHFLAYTFQNFPVSFVTFIELLQPGHKSQCASDILQAIKKTYYGINLLYLSVPLF